MDFKSLKNASIIGILIMGTKSQFGTTISKFSASGISLKKIINKNIVVRRTDSEISPKLECPHCFGPKPAKGLLVWSDELLMLTPYGYLRLSDARNLLRGGGGSEPSKEGGSPFTGSVCKLGQLDTCSSFKDPPNSKLIRLGSVSKFQFFRDAITLSQRSMRSSHKLRGNPSLGSDSNSGQSSITSCCREELELSQNWAKEVVISDIGHHWERRTKLWAIINIKLCQKGRIDGAIRSNFLFTSGIREGPPRLLSSRESRNRSSGDGVWPVAQRIRARGYEPQCRGFESLLAHNWPKREGPFPSGKLQLHQANLPKLVIVGLRFINLFQTRPLLCSEACSADSHDVLSTLVSILISLRTWGFCTYECLKALLPPVHLLECTRCSHQDCRSAGKQGYGDNITSNGSNTLSFTTLLITLGGPTMNSYPSLRLEEWRKFRELHENKMKRARHNMVPRPLTMNVSAVSPSSTFMAKLRSSSRLALIMVSVLSPPGSIA
ncbi:hypothetical protein G4B88_020781 [Cannabis sativa]|uniref:Uncharacterized protein n=1 Tax=Cannabis sativa TaxID=3483 RepID=A0A7J6HLL5_CANSA|nr:hypothetical protein G4B88_020781 [Cannabis sativa]